MTDRTNIPPATGIRSRLDPAEDERGGRSFFSMGRGYIRLHRSLTDWEWYHNERLKSVFIHLLVRCNWSDKNWQGIEVKAGTFITSTGHLAEELHLSRSAVVRALDRLEKSGEIVVKADNKRTAITLVNWAKYQSEDVEAGQPSDNKRTTSGQPADTTKKEKKEKQEEESVDAPKRIPSSKWSKEEFKAKCAAAVSGNDDRLPKEHRLPFFEYWTEEGANGKMRFQDEKFFDVGRRMDRWKNNNFGTSTFAAKAKGPMTKADAEAWIEKYKERLGLKPGDAIPTAEIPNDIYHAWRGYAKS